MRSIVGIGAGIVSILMVGGLEKGPGSWLQWILAVGSTTVFGCVVYRYTMNHRTEKSQRERDDLRRHVNRY